MFTFDIQPQWLPPPATESPEPTPRRFQGIAYAGGIIPSFGNHGDTAIDLAGFSETPVVLLASHSKEVSAIAGHGRAWRTDDGQLAVAGELSQVTEAGKIIAGLLAEGIQVPLSVGVQADIEVGRAGRKVTLNNRELRLKTVFRAPRLREVSFVPVGADPQAHAAQCAAQEAVMADEDFEAQLGEWKAKLAKAEERAVLAESRVAELEKTLTGLRQAARKVQVEDLHAKLNRPITETALAMYQSLSDEQFAAVKGELLTMAPKPATGALQADPLLAQAAQTVTQTVQAASLGSLFEMAYNKRVF